MILNNLGDSLIFLPALPAAQRVLCEITINFCLDILVHNVAQTLVC